jgi:hypothetical protein
LRPSNSDANAAAAPVCSVPATGWPGTQARQRVREYRAGRRDHVLLGAAGIGDDGGRTDGARNRAKQHRKLGHGCRDEHDVGVGSFARPVLVQRNRAVDRATRERCIEIGLRAADAHDFGHGAGTLQRERARAADQSDADDHELCDAHWNSVNEVRK